MYEFPEEIGKNHTQVFSYQTIAAIYSNLVIHNLGFIFLLKFASNKKNQHIHIEHKEIHRARYSQNYLSRRRKCYDVYLFIGIFKSLCCNKHGSNAKWRVFPSKSFFGGWGWSTVSMNYDFVLVIAWSVTINVRPVVSPCIIVHVQYQTYFSITSEMSKDLLTKNQFSLRILSRHSISILYV